MTGIYAKIFCIYAKYNTNLIMQDNHWNGYAKRLLKSELMRRGITNEDLVRHLDNIGVEETKTSIDSKISRGTFSAAFLLQCLNAIGCKNFDPAVMAVELVEEPKATYKSLKSKSKRSLK